MKKRFPLLAIVVVLFLVFASQLTITSCTKDKIIVKHDTTTIIDTPAVCNVQGTYAGTAIASPNASTAGQTNPETYVLQGDNLAVGYDAHNNAVTFGGYTNTCDSIVISSYYTGTGEYYILKGVLNSGKTMLSGTFQNLTTTTDFGTFSFTKQP